MATTVGGGRSSHHADDPYDRAMLLPWPRTLHFVDVTCDGRDIQFNIWGYVERGVSLLECSKQWTSYRRNLLCVSCGFDLPPSSDRSRIFLNRMGIAESVQRMGIRLAAEDTIFGNNVELVQFTAPRGQGPTSKVGIEEILPGPVSMEETLAVSPSDPLLDLSGASWSPTALPAPLKIHYAHTYDRLQFPRATKKSRGKSPQEHFRLKVELYADIGGDRCAEPQWIKVAQLQSDDISVRGMSPSSYLEKDMQSQTRPDDDIASRSNYEAATCYWKEVQQNRRTKLAYAVLELFEGSKDVGTDMWPCWLIEQANAAIHLIEGSKNVVEDPAGWFWSPEFNSH